jgi:hypothetical protein
MTFIEAGLFHDKRKELERLQNIFGRFYLFLVVIDFNEEELFHDKRMNLIVYERVSVDFIGM